ncbi:MAG: flap endonuclease-1 [Candidatus Hydrothermarchaeales archaeon]
MGVQLTDLVRSKPIQFKELAGKRVAIDAMNSLYQFLSIIRQPTGEPLKDSSGRVTSHLSGLLYRNVNLMDFGILPVYVFDGKPPRLKDKVVVERTEIRTGAEKKWKEALAAGDLEKARSFAQQASRLSEEMIQDSKRLLEYMGIPTVQAPTEGEAQAAYMTAKGDVWATGSQDYDSLLFGAPRLVRNLTISGRRKIPRKNIYVDVAPEIFHLDKALEELQINREQLIELSMLIGTDYDPGGVEGVGPKKAYKLIKEFGNAKKAVEDKGLHPDFDIDEIKELFLNPDFTDDYELKWEAPDADKAVQFLCDERDFSVERVEKAMQKLETKLKEVGSQSSLDGWF